MPQTMCLDPVCTVAEVWCCSEHYSGFLTVISWWRHGLQCIVVWQYFLRLLKLDKLAVGKHGLSRGGLTCCHGVLDHGLNLRPNVLLKGSITECSRVSQLKDDHYCGTLLHSVIDSQGFPTTRKASWVMSFVYIIRQIRQLYQMFDTLKYVLGPYF